MLVVHRVDGTTYSGQLWSIDISDFRSLLYTAMPKYTFTWLIHTFQVLCKTCLVHTF